MGQKLSPEGRRRKNAYIGEYNRRTYVQVKVDIPPEVKEGWQEAAQSEGMSLRAWIMEAADEKMGKNKN